MLPELSQALADRYRVERELGRGGMATVHLARDLRNDQLVALKVLHPQLAFTLGADRFAREIRVAARLDHPNILRVLDSGDIGGQLWFAMPYVEGESLYERLQRERQLPTDEALRIAFAVASALAYANEQGVVHRDIKPDNIMLSGDRRARGGLRRGAGGERDAIEAHRHRHDRGNADLHEPRAGRRRAQSRRAERHLRTGVRDIRDAGGRAAVQGTDAADDLDAASDAAGEAAAANGERDRGRGVGYSAGAGEGPGGALGDGRRLRRRARREAQGAALAPSTIFTHTSTGSGRRAGSTAVVRCFSHRRRATRLPPRVTASYSSRLMASKRNPFVLRLHVCGWTAILVLTLLVAVLLWSVSGGNWSSTAMGAAAFLLIALGIERILVWLLLDRVLKATGKAARIAGRVADGDLSLPEGRPPLRPRTCSPRPSPRC